MYGQSFSLADNNQNGVNAPTYGGGEAGEETRARGFLSYYEVRIERFGGSKADQNVPDLYQRDQQGLDGGAG
jgi:hypothetical protein